MRISLAQVGRWLVERGQVPEGELKDVIKEFTPEELERWSMTSDTPSGQIAASASDAAAFGNAAVLGAADGAAGLPQARVSAALTAQRVIPSCKQLPEGCLRSEHLAG